MELDARKQKVLHAIVTDYVRTAEPVGSERLAETHALDAKAATIRNEMAALAGLGYLAQPHTSAGRIPSDKGYRFYVDRLMHEDVTAVRVPKARFDAELDEVLRQTCRLLSGITRCAAIATPPTRDSVSLQQVYVTPHTGSRVIVVAVMSSGEVQHRITDLGNAVPAATLTRLNNLFNEQWSGLTLEAVRSTRLSLPGDLAAFTAPAAKIAAALVEVAALDPEAGTVMEGATQVLREPEFQDQERRESLLRALEDRRAVLESLRAMSGDVGVTIGSENPHAAMRHFSFVSTQYHVGVRMTGVIGVFGPTRMAYSHTVPAVRQMARMLGEVLTRLSVE